MTTNGKPDTAARIRSFVKRPGRLTRGQKRALESLWPRFGLAATATIDFDTLFGRSHGDRVLEIGYGDGDSLVALAAAHPDYRVLGCEVHEPGIGHCLLAIEEAGLENVRLIGADAVDLLTAQIGPAALERINLYFPDPWPKKRHHKRRLFSLEFLALADRALSIDGTLHIATDWAPYAEHVD
ncbi:MAG: tRNA (guanosine(46)-N7)-methyltransferase TrmB, partial [Pseudomonadota bacterium]